MEEPKPGGIHDSDESTQNSAEIEGLALFAVQQYNKTANGPPVELERVVKVKEQVVAGVMYYLTLEVKEGEEKKLYEAKVWVKPWMNFKELQEFNPVETQSQVDDAAAAAAVIN
ncbi:cysteine proteinase inhibitor A-like [Zingiber officinale]|uniref:cysteine proteinase inhibitor A-like n=1 Tax=Zingiber officinale TaxID=94328 RepID=UPI001C4DACF5|nr:cysteine proteinase inhibitor A-like [Zingiber officinale]